MTIHNESTICDFLTSNGVAFERFDHPPVFTVEESKKLKGPMPGTDTKNLFLRDKKGRRHFLVTVGHEKRVDVRVLEQVVDAKALSFASADRLKKFLGVDPGAVTMLGLINDTAHAVEFFIDKPLWEAEALCCHPLVNTSTLAISHEGLAKFFELTGHAVHPITVPAKDH